MAKRTCPYCRKKGINHKATVCPYCRKELTPVSFWKTGKGIILIIIGVFFLLIEISSLLTPNKTELARKESEKAAMARKETVDKLRTQFTQNKDSILAELDDLLKMKKYKEVMKRAAPYLFIKDERLTSIYNTANKQYLSIRNKKREMELLAEAKKIPSSEWNINKRIYSELMHLNPKNPTYKKKYEYYDNKIRDKEKAEAAKKAREAKIQQARISKFGIPPTQSAWDGSYRIINKYLKMVANDPDSVKIETCTSVYASDDGWVVGCDWRAKNLFGGYVRKSNWFLIKYGQVIEMKPFSAYKVDLNLKEGHN